MMKCPSCGGTADSKYRPFCSKRCAERDLGNWFSERYSIPNDEAQLPDGAQEDAADPWDRIN